MDARDAALSMWDVIQFGRALSEPMRKLQNLRMLLYYGLRHTARGTRRTPMDVDALVARWVPVIRAITAAHDRAEVDAAEFEMDACLAPILAAPVAQIREFWPALCAALDADPGVPYYARAIFAAWGEVKLKPAPDAAVKKLKLELAEKIADLVEQKIPRLDLRAAIIGALQWRQEEQLVEIESAVKKGGRPRLVGRESCLFLEIHPEDAAPEADHEDENPIARVML